MTSISCIEIRDASPDRISGFHPVWARSIQGFGPWEPAVGDRWISQGCRPEAPVLIYPSCDSTMELLRRLRAEGRAPDRTSALAVEQTAGRGQRGRSWMSPAGNLYAAWHWPPLSPGLLPLAPYIIALGLSRALENKGQKSELKWPNDILAAGRKAAGILITQSGGESIVGVGVNLSWSPGDRVLAVQGAPAATNLAEQGVLTDPIELWTDILHFTKEIFELSSHQILQNIEKRLAWIGQPVMIATSGNDAARHATLIGLAEDGALVVEEKGQRQRIYSASLAPVKGE